MPFIDELLKYTNDYFIETGTYQGETIDIIKNSNKYKYIYSIELSEVFYYNCINKFINNKNVKIFKGNSRYDLFKIIFNINTNITFWLDGHWSGVPNVGCDKELLCPVLYELEQIKRHHISTHTIIIDDIRLMDGCHFEVTVQQIINKIYEINPDYKIIFYDDNYSKNDILVAYIDTLNITKRKQHICVHKYLTFCKTNPMPPGLGDFIRGTITLFNYSKKYNYKLYIDNSHPIFKNLLENPLTIEDKKSDDVIELLPPLSYYEIDKYINNLFLANKSFYVMTNGFYSKTADGILENFGDITIECKHFLRQNFTPNLDLKLSINKVFEKIGINQNDCYSCIHLRLGDNFLHENIYDEKLFEELNNKIHNILLNNKTQKFILLSDSLFMSIKIKEQNPELYYWENKKIHIGNLKSSENIELAVRDTLIDFFIMSQCKNIYTYAFNGTQTSGFSKMISLIFDIHCFIL